MRPQLWALAFFFCGVFRLWFCDRLKHSTSPRERHLNSFHGAKIGQHFGAVLFILVEMSYRLSRGHKASCGTQSLVPCPV